VPVPPATVVVPASPSGCLSEQQPDVSAVVKRWLANGGPAGDDVVDALAHDLALQLAYGKRAYTICGKKQP